jgi:hypothetical protein
VVVEASRARAKSRAGSQGLARALSNWRRGQDFAAPIRVGVEVQRRGEDWRSPR